MFCRFLAVRSHLNKVFWSTLCVGRSVLILEILLMYSCYRSDCYAVGLNLAAALILNQNPFFEIASIHKIITKIIKAACQ